jgi:hypothetical protein
MEETTTRVRSEMRASLSELAPQVTMLVEACGRGFRQAATSHLLGRHRDADGKTDDLRMSADVGKLRIYAWLSEITIWTQTLVSETYLEGRFHQRTSSRGPEIPGDTLSG